jgi:hypothetical protein
MSDKYQALRDALKAGPTGGTWTVSWDGVITIGGPQDSRVILSANVMDDQRRIDAHYCAEAYPATITALLADLDAERLECMAQAKLNGIGAERELALMAERDALKADLDAAVGALTKIAASNQEWGPFPETKPEWAAMAIVTARETVATLSQIKAAGREQA